MSKIYHLCLILYKKSDNILDIFKTFFSKSFKIISRAYILQSETRFPKSGYENYKAISRVVIEISLFKKITYTILCFLLNCSYLGKVNNICILIISSDRVNTQ